MSGIIKLQVYGKSLVNEKCHVHATSIKQLDSVPHAHKPILHSAHMLSITKMLQVLLETSLREFMSVNKCTAHTLEIHCMRYGGSAYPSWYV